jgi:hypothetical protein
LAAIEIIFTVFGGLVSAVIAGILLKLWLTHIFRPKLFIDGNKSIDVTYFHLLDRDSKNAKFWGNRIRVRNAGRSAAKDCKAYVCYTKSNIRRGAWLIPNKDSGYTITLNVDDREFVDLCCISDDGQTRIIPPEHGYSIVKRFDDYVPLEQKWGYITVRITSSNAKPVERKVKLHTTVDHFTKQRGRIVEFLDEDPLSDHVDDALPEDEGDGSSKPTNAGST